MSDDTEAQLYLQAEIERLQIELKAAQTGIGALQETVERLRAALVQISTMKMASRRPPYYYEIVRDIAHKALNGTGTEHPKSDGSRR